MGLGRRRVGEVRRTAIPPLRLLSTSTYCCIAPLGGSTWGDYRWLEVDAPGSGFLPGGFTLSDHPGPTSSGRTIEFAALASSPHRYVVPVSSCPQWRGYGSRPLFLTSSTPQEIGRVALIR